MNEWELVNEPAQATQQQTPSDWEMVQQPQPKESFGEALRYAPGRVITDVAKGAYEQYQKIPEYYQAAKINVPAALAMPARQAHRQYTAGLAELGQNIFNTPHDLVNYLTQRLHLVPENVNQVMQMARMPKDTQQMINQHFGEATQPGEKFLRGVGRNQLLVMGLGGAAASAARFITPTKKSIRNTILDTHDKLESSASKKFSNVSEGVNQRGIATIPVNPAEIETLREYFPRTRHATELVDRAKEGDYNALRKMQSDLYKRGKRNMGSTLETDRLRGAEMLEKRNNINQDISEWLDETGNHDLSRMLNSARDEYRTLQEVYYNPNMNNAIVNMVNRDYRKIPKNLTDILLEESNPMEALRKFHPDLGKSLSGYHAKKNALSGLKKYGFPAALGLIGGYEGAKYATSK